MLVNALLYVPALTDLRLPRYELSYYTGYMLQILLHSSKTMSSRPDEAAPLGVPMFADEAKRLADVWRQQSVDELARLMKISSKKAAEVKTVYDNWSLQPGQQTPAVDAFRGDIYSGLQASTWSTADRDYAHKHLVILSGLYGALRAGDGVMPYRLEMGYKLPSGESMYQFWGGRLCQIIAPSTDHVINLSAVEYTKALLPHVSQPVITPKFLTVSPKTGQPAFVTVHAKIARGAFANWLIRSRIDDVDKLADFTDLGYHYDAALSTPDQPVFVCQTFQGLGLSVR